MAATSDDTKNVNTSLFSSYQKASDLFSGLKKMINVTFMIKLLLYRGSAVRIHAVEILNTPF